jgi:short-subunit dehydrogenase
VTLLNVLVIGAPQGIGAGIAEAYARTDTTNLLLAARQSSFDKLLAIERKVKGLAPSVLTRCLDVDINSLSSVSHLS